MKLLLVTLALTLGANLFADALPTLSAKCKQAVKTNGYCTETSLVMIPVNPTNSTFSNETKEAVKVFVYVEADFYKVEKKFNVESYEEGANKLIGLYQDHKKWPTYATESGLGILRFIESKDLAPVTYVKDNISYNAIPHVAHYSLDTKIPLINWEETYEVSYNYEITPWTGAFRSIAYEAIFNKGYKYLGVKHKSGSVHIAWDEDAGIYKLYSVNYVIPKFDDFMTPAKAPIASGIEAILIGMLSDYLNN